MGAQCGAHFQFASPNFLTQSMEMKPGLVLLFTRDDAFDRLVSEALQETGAVILLTRSVAQALQIVCQRGRELNLALMDFEEGCRGMTLLSAVHTCYEQLPILVTTLNDAYHAKAVAYANGARACLNKPVSATKLASTIADLQQMQSPLAAA